MTEQKQTELTIENGYVKFTKKPTKMGSDFIFWIPRAYIKNSIIDPTCEYEVYMKKVKKNAG